MKVDNYIKATTPPPPVEGCGVNNKQVGAGWASPRQSRSLNADGAANTSVCCQQVSGLMFQAYVSPAGTFTTRGIPEQTFDLKRKKKCGGKTWVNRVSGRFLRKVYGLREYIFVIYLICKMKKKWKNCVWGEIISWIVNMHIQTNKYFLKRGHGEHSYILVSLFYLKKRF